MLWAQAEEVINALRDNWIGLAIATGVLIALVVLFKIATGRKRPFPDLENSQREDLRTFPPPPAVRSRRLSVNGEPVRLRLVVVAPTGKLQDPISPDGVAELLDNVVRGLGAFVESDKPRIKVWSPQLSVSGFAPTFHRLVASPDAEGKPTRWVKLAGPARTGKRPILLGLALLADEESKLGDLQVETTEWSELLEVSR
jgi:hypothetical protein